MRDKRSYSQHSSAIVESENIGDGTRIWAFAHVLKGATIGKDCNICDHTFIENDVTVGDRVTIKCGVQLWDGTRIESDVFIGPNATFSNDRFPRSRRRPQHYSETVVRSGASIGANATILPGIVIGENAMVGAGSVVTRNVPPLAIVIGNPARISGYDGARSSGNAASPLVPGLRKSTIPGVALHRLPSASDMRGLLSFGEFGQNVPFFAKRYFVVYGVPTEEVRGEHAHRALRQFLVCVHGSCRIMATDGYSQEEFLLDDPTLGLDVGPMVWTVQYKHSRDSVLLVLASDLYDPADYIREYKQFLQEVSKAESDPAE